MNNRPIEHNGIATFRKGREKLKIKVPKEYNSLEELMLNIQFAYKEYRQLLSFYNHDSEHINYLSNLYE